MSEFSFPQISASPLTRRKGGPLALLGIVLLSWAVMRSVIWESPFALLEIGSPLPAILADTKPAGTREPLPNGQIDRAVSVAKSGAFYGPRIDQTYNWRLSPALSGSAYLAVGHQRLMSEAFGVDWHSDGARRFSGGSNEPQNDMFDTTSNLVPSYASEASGSEALVSGSGRPDRLSLDAFLFYRDGSVSTSQGRFPAYGSSQASANLQYRFAPRSRFDPSGFVRAYRALVDGGETELAGGISARPVPPVPVRLHAEMRVAKGPGGTDYRPAAYLVSALPPQQLPMGMLLETYAAAGYVGGEADTHFADGQAILTREIIAFEGPTGSPLRLSLGGGGWGGAQEGVERFDVGPTMRLDLSVGEVPARISVDYRARVAGAAEPNSGVAATVSTRF